jgi:hypothetical protein
MSGRRGTTILVTAVGDRVGQALVKTARQMALPCRIVGTDRSSETDMQVLSELKFSSDRFVDDTERVWAKEKGARVFHLGGGGGSQKDSVFRYKAGFSDRRHAFFTWRWILQPDVFEELRAKKTRWNTANRLRPTSAGYFPSCRCPAVPVGEQQFFVKKTASPCAATPR